MMTLEKIEVGKPFLFKTRKSNVDGAYLENTGAGLWIQTIYLTDITYEEQLRVIESEIEFRYIQENGNLLPMVSYGQDFVFEMSLDPTLYKTNNVPINLNQLLMSNSLCVVLIESRTNIVKALRVTEFPEVLFEVMTKNYEKAFEDTHYSEKYLKWINECRNIDLLDLWNMAIKI